MKKTYNTLELIMGLMVAISIFYVFFNINNGTEIMAVEYYNGQGDYIGEDSLNMPKSIQLSQSLFKNKNIIVPFELQSTIPIDKGSNTEIIFRSEITNPFNERAQMLFVTIYKNGERFGDKHFLQYYMGSNDVYLYKSIPLNLEGVEAQRNILKIVFTFENSAKERKEVVYEYHYLFLVECVGDNQCSYFTPECDIHNQARFSTDPNIFYCTKPCNNNIDCPTDQLCLQGLCGY